MAKVERRSFQYQKRSKDDVKERANAQGGGFDRFIKPSYKTYKVRDGKNLIRVLPPTWEGAKHYGYDIYVNYGIGVDDQSYLSLSRMLSKPDPLAEARRAAEREGNQELAKQLNPTQRVLMWLIDRLNEDEGPQLWAAPFTVDKALANISFDEDTREVIYIDDPEEGCDVRFYREGQGLKTKYDGSKMKLLKPTPLHEDSALMNEWLDYVSENPIPDCLNYYDYDHILSVYDGQTSNKAKGKDEDDEDVRPSSRTKPKPVTEPVDDDDDDGDRDPPRKPAREEPTRRRPTLQAEPDETDGSDDEPPFEPSKPKGGGESIRERLSRRRTQQHDEGDD
jgi:hypothetical protein